jgi:4-amino-4-deoxy-L-arabinose transferase-like glycosyltransferase
MKSSRRRFLAVLIAVYVAKQVVTALLFPAFTGHDEVAHFQYVRVVAIEGRVPTLYSHTMPVDLYRYRQYAITWKAREGIPLYTAVHPPLYYALMAPIYRAAHGMTPEAIHYILRLSVIPFGALVVLLAYLLATAVFPRDGFLAVTVPAAVAFQPQVSYGAAMVNNDILATLLVSWLLYLMALVVRDGVSTRRAILVGFVAGLAFLAKATALVCFGLIPVAFWLGRRGGTLTDVARSSLIAGLPLMVLTVPWLWFVARVYGDPLGISALAASQPGLVHDKPFLELLFSGSFLVERWTETWGEFGWKAIEVSGALISVLGILAVAGLLGLLMQALPVDQEKGRFEPWQRSVIVILACACVLSYLGAVQFGTRFVLTQARYYFPVLNGAVLLLMVGLSAWIPCGWRIAAQAVVVLGVIVVNIVIYTAYVVPYWHFRP